MSAQESTTVDELDLFERAKRLSDRGRAFVLGRMLEASKRDESIGDELSKAIDGALALSRPTRQVSHEILASTT